MCKSCPSSSWLLYQPSVKSWSTTHRTASASGRKSPLPYPGGKKKQKKKGRRVFHTLACPPLRQLRNVLTEAVMGRSRSLHFVPRSAGYTQKRLTENLKVPYYVGEQFSKEVSGVLLKNLERTVEDDYISNLRNNCWKEKQQSTCASEMPPVMIAGPALALILRFCLSLFPAEEGMLYRARYFGDTDLYQRAQRARTPSCAKLSEITASLHG